MEGQDFYDFTRCVRPNGTAYGTGGKCRKGQEEALSQRVGKGFLAKASTEKLKEYANRAPYKYQREAIKAELARRGAGEAKSQKKAPSVPTDLKRQLAALDGPTNRGLQREKNKLDREQQALQKQLDELIALRDGKAPKKDEKLSQKINAKMLRDAPKEKLEEYLKRAPYQYQRDKIKKALEEREKADAGKTPAKPAPVQAQAPVGRPKGMSSWDLENAVNTDKRIEKGLTKEVGDQNFAWTNSLSSGAKVLGSGAYGTAVKDANGDVVKRGTIGNNEADIIAKVGKADLGPRLISAQLDGPTGIPNTSTGRVAMTVVPGSPIGKKKGDAPIGKTGKVVADAYWEARAKLHRLGIAHNDMHIENVFIDRKGTGRFVDMGLAQDNPKAALAEAMGAFRSPPMGTVRKGGTDSGDWQMRRWDGSGGKDFDNADRSTSPAVRREFARRFPVAAKVLENKKKAINKMKSMGLSDQDVADIMGHGIRSKDSSFEKGAMGKLTNAQAQSIIDTLYDGI